MRISGFLQCTTNLLQTITTQWRVSFLQVVQFTDFDSTVWVCTKTPYFFPKWLQLDDLAILFAVIFKLLTFIGFLRLSDVGVLIYFVQIFFASISHALIFFIFNRFVVSKPIREMMASLVVVKLLTRIISPLFSQSSSFDQKNNGSENHLLIFSKNLISNPLDASSAGLF